MKCVEDYVLAKFIGRPNRFLAVVRLVDSDLDDDISIQTKAHVSDPGRLKELLIPGTDVVLRRSNNINRKTQYSLVGVRFEDIWVNIDSQITNKLFQEEFSKIKRLADYKIKKTEFTYSKSRIDFLLEHKHNGNEALVEIKSVTLVNEDKALFPDAPTTRGLKHVLELNKSLAEYPAAFIVFIIKRSDAESFSPNFDIDPDFSRALIDAKNKGVTIIAVKCHYDPIKTQSLSIVNEVKIDWQEIEKRFSHFII
ncbi:MAG: DNA/RNA nuclease SfsA [Candidatus Hodarchaeales archaeon]